MENMLLEAGGIAQSIPGLEMMIFGIPLAAITMALLLKGQLFKNW